MKVIASFLIAILLVPIGNIGFAQYFDDDINRFRIQPPPNWQISLEDDPNYGRIVFIVSNEKYQGNFPPFFFIIRMSGEKAKYSPNFINDIPAQENFIKGFVRTGLKDEQVKEIRVDNWNIEKSEDGYIFEIQGEIMHEKEKDSTQFASIGFILNSNEILGLVYYADPVDYWNSFAKFFKSVESFQYEKRKEEAKIPNWIRNNALWWSQGKIKDTDFISGIEYLITNGIMKIPKGVQVKTDALPGVPNWIKDTAGWWADRKVTDTDFVNGIQYLIGKGIILVSQVSESPCAGKALCLSAKVQKIVDGDTIDIEGYRIRLALTDTPEKYEDRYNESTAFTRNLCPVGTLILVDQDDKQPYDNYDRLLGKVTCQGKILNAELLYNGFAKIITRYCGTSEFASEDWAKSYGC
jgi:hypothetical protein